MAEVIFNKLEKVYSNGFKAVHGIDLKIADGEFMVIVGPSGCAKSTTLRMLAGLETISGGEVRIGEKIYVLHAFQKKSKAGIKTPQEDVKLIGERLKRAQQDYESSTL